MRGDIAARLVQLDSLPGSDYHIQPGYSGSPVIAVYSARVVVVGMVVAARSSEEANHSFALSVPHLMSACSDLLQGDAGDRAQSHDAGLPRRHAQNVAGERGNRELSRAFKSVSESYGDDWHRVRGPWSIDSLLQLEAEVVALDGSVVLAGRA